MKVRYIIQRIYCEGTHNQHTLSGAYLTFDEAQNGWNQMVKYHQDTGLKATLVLTRQRIEEETLETTRV